MEGRDKGESRIQGLRARAEERQGARVGSEQRGRDKGGGGEREQRIVVVRCKEREREQIRGEREIIGAGRESQREMMGGNERGGDKHN